MPVHSYSDNALATIALCSEVNVPDGCQALDTSEWSQFTKLLVKNSLQPGAVLRFSGDDWCRLLYPTVNNEADLQRLAGRFYTLAGRVNSLEHVLSWYQARSISLITRSDLEYPSLLKHRLKHDCPPLFYVAGDASILHEPGFKAIGLVGSSQVEQGDYDFLRDFVRKLIRFNFVLVSGGATRLDQIAIELALDAGGKVVLFPAEQMIRLFAQTSYNKALYFKQMVMLSALSPEQEFSAEQAWQRNKFIHALSEAVVVIRADFPTPDARNRTPAPVNAPVGSWTDAIDALQQKCAPVLCRNALYLGNLRLLHMGAFPLDESWNGVIPATLRPVRAPAAAFVRAQSQDRSQALMGSDAPFTPQFPSQGSSFNQAAGQAPSSGAGQRPAQNFGAQNQRQSQRRNQGQSQDQWQSQSQGQNQWQWQGQNREPMFVPSGQNRTYGQQVQNSWLPPQDNQPLQAPVNQAPFGQNQPPRGQAAPAPWAPDQSMPSDAPFPQQFPSQDNAFNPNAGQNQFPGVEQRPGQNLGRNQSQGRSQWQRQGQGQSRGQGQDSMSVPSGQNRAQGQQVAGSWLSSQNNQPFPAPVNQAPLGQNQASQSQAQIQTAAASAPLGQGQASLQPEAQLSPQFMAQVAAINAARAAVNPAAASAYDQNRSQSLGSQSQRQMQPSLNQGRNFERMSGMTAPEQALVPAASRLQAQGQAQFAPNGNGQPPFASGLNTPVPQQGNGSYFPGVGSNSNNMPFSDNQGYGSQGAMPSGQNWTAPDNARLSGWQQANGNSNGNNMQLPSPTMMPPAPQSLPPQPWQSPAQPSLQPLPPQSQQALSAQLQQPVNAGQQSPAAPQSQPQPYSNYYGANGNAGGMNPHQNGAGAGNQSMGAFNAMMPNDNSVSVSAPISAPGAASAASVLASSATPAPAAAPGLIAGAQTYLSAAAQVGAPVPAEAASHLRANSSVPGLEPGISAPYGTADNFTGTDGAQNGNGIPGGNRGYSDALKGYDPETDDNEPDEQEPGMPPLDSEPSAGESGSESGFMGGNTTADNRNSGNDPSWSPAENHDSDGKDNALPPDLWAEDQESNEEPSVEAGSDTAGSVPPVGEEKSKPVPNDTAVFPYGSEPSPDALVKTSAETSASASVGAVPAPDSMSSSQAQAQKPDVLKDPEMKSDFAYEGLEPAEPKVSAEIHLVAADTAKIEEDSKDKQATAKDAVTSEKDSANITDTANSADSAASPAAVTAAPDAGSASAVADAGADTAKTLGSSDTTDAVDKVNPTGHDQTSAAEPESESDAEFDALILEPMRPLENIEAEAGSPDSGESVSAHETKALSEKTGSVTTEQKDTAVPTLDVAAAVSEIESIEALTAQDDDKTTDAAVAAPALELDAAANTSEVTDVAAGGADASVVESLETEKLTDKLNAQDQESGQEQALGAGVVVADDSSFAADSVSAIEADGSADESTHQELDDTPVQDVKPENEVVASEQSSDLTVAATTATEVQTEAEAKETKESELVTNAQFSAQETVESTEAADSKETTETELATDAMLDLFDLDAVFDEAEAEPSVPVTESAESGSALTAADKSVDTTAVETNTTENEDTVAADNAAADTVIADVSTAGAETADESAAGAGVKEDTIPHDNTPATAVTTADEEKDEDSDAAKETSEDSPLKDASENAAKDGTLVDTSAEPAAESVVVETDASAVKTEVSEQEQVQEPGAGAAVVNNSSAADGAAADSVSTVEPDSSADDSTHQNLSDTPAQDVKSEAGAEADAEVESKAVTESETVASEVGTAAEATEILVVSDTTENKEVEATAAEATAAVTDEPAPAQETADKATVSDAVQESADAADTATVDATAAVDEADADKTEEKIEAQTESEEHLSSESKEEAAAGNTGNADTTQEAAAQTEQQFETHGGQLAAEETAAVTAVTAAQEAEEKVEAADSVETAAMPDTSSDGAQEKHSSQSPDESLQSGNGTSDKAENQAEAPELTAQPAGMETESGEQP